MCVAPTRSGSRCRGPAGSSDAQKTASNRLWPRAPATLHFVGVEGIAFGEYGTELTPQVEAAIPDAVEAVLRVVGATPELLAAGRAASSSRQASHPFAGIPTKPSPQRTCRPM